MGLADQHISGAHAWSSVMGVTSALRVILKCVKIQPFLLMAMFGIGGETVATRSHGANEHVVLSSLVRNVPVFILHYAMQGQLHFQQWMGGSL